jgi:hypothetical protein
MGYNDSESEDDSKGSGISGIRGNSVLPVGVLGGILVNSLSVRLLEVHLRGSVFEDLFGGRVGKVLVFLVVYGEIRCSKKSVKPPQQRWWKTLDKLKEQGKNRNTPSIGKV